jgi:hypothetical protein
MVTNDMGCTSVMNIVGEHRVKLTWSDNMTRRSGLEKEGRQEGGEL